MLNKRQKSREQPESHSRLLRQAAPNGAQASKEGHHLVSQDEVYRRAPNVMHMPEVVSKVTQNSISFTAEQRPRKHQHNLIQPSATTNSTVPAISPAGGLDRKSREGGTNQNASETQYSDLGSSYKSGHVSGAPDHSHFKGGSSFSKKASAQSQAQYQLDQQRTAQVLR